MVTNDMLRQNPNLAHLNDEALTKLSSIAEQQSAAANQTIFVDRDPADKLFLIVHGEVNVCCEMGSGELRVMDTVAEGELFAWSALVEPYRYTSTAVAARDTELIGLDAAKLRKFCEEDCELSFHLLTKIVELLSNRLESVRVQLAAV